MKFPDRAGKKEKVNRQEIKDLTISIVSYNSLNFLKPCLDSIYNSPPSIKYDIVVVDNASSDDSACSNIMFLNTS